MTGGRYARAAATAVLALAIVLVASATAAPADVSARASADATVGSTKNNGRSTRLLVAARPRTRSYVRFDLSGITGAVASAQLRLYAVSSVGRGVTLRQAGGSWSERTINASNAPAPTGAATTVRPRGRGWVVVDVTSFIQRGAASFVLSSSAGRAVFGSRESKTPPRLVIATTSDPQLVAAGDIAACDSSGDEATAAVVASSPGTVAALGDVVYESGTAAEFASCYDPSWGRFKARTRPAAGNHEYETPNAEPYYAYFGAAAGPPGSGHYSYDLGTWHVVVLNSMCVDGCEAGSAQEQWLRADLAAHATRCTLAYWHHPRFSSGQVASDARFQPFWQALYDAGADVILNGHAHNYQRFAPQTPIGEPDPARGIREFVVGTGGKRHHPVGTPIANTESANQDTFGVLRMTLHATSYDWRFVPVAGATFTDSGSASCH